MNKILVTIITTHEANKTQMKCIKILKIILNEQSS